MSSLLAREMGQCGGFRCCNFCYAVLGCWSGLGFGGNVLYHLDYKVFAVGVGCQSGSEALQVLRDAEVKFH